MAHSEGVIPDGVIRDHRAEGLLVFVNLQPELDRTGLQEWLRQVTDLIGRLSAPVAGGRVASVAVAFGRSFFVNPDGSFRFELGEKIPVGLRSLPTVQNVSDPASAATDVIFYIMTTSEAAAAGFFEGLSSTRQYGLQQTRVERGFQRKDKRELGGFLDGVRNVPGNIRDRAVFVNRELAPDEPDWTEDGTYLAYLKVSQNLDHWRTLTDEQQEQIIGRRKKDGSRLDLPEGSNPREEGSFSNGMPSTNSHVRKSGPRGDESRDQVTIFRLGVPYLNLREDGGLDGGLHFISFQWSMDMFEVMLAGWMQNPNFPATGHGMDRLFTEGLANIEKSGFYFVPPHDDRFVGASLFDEPRTAGRPRDPGYIVIRKRAVDANGTRIMAEVGGILFQVFRANPDGSAGEAIGDLFTTNSAGHAISPGVPLRTSLVLREVGTPSHLQQMPDQQITLTAKRQVVQVNNQIVGSAGPGYGS